MDSCQEDLIVMCDNKQLSGSMAQNLAHPASDTPEQVGKRLAELVASRYGVLIALSQGDRFSVADIITMTEEDRGNLSRHMAELEDRGLVKSSDEPSEKLGRPKKIYKLTELGRKLIAPFLEASEPVKLLEPDAEEVGLLVRIINSVSTEEARGVAIRDLIELSKTTRLWKQKRFMDFLEQGLAKEPLRLTVLDLIRMVCSTAIRDGDRKTAQGLLERYGKDAEAIVRDRAQERHLRSSAMLTYVELEEANETKDSELMALTEHLLEKESNDENFSDLQPYMLLWLRGFWKTNPRDARKWVYQLMQKPDQRVVKRAVQLHAGIE
jgi:DNA-binding MarR family transcriptional regulator